MTSFGTWYEKNNTSVTPSPYMEGTTQSHQSFGCLFIRLVFGPILHSILPESKFFLAFRLCLSFWIGELLLLSFSASHVQWKKKKTRLLGRKISVSIHLVVKREKNSEMVIMDLLYNKTLFEQVGLLVLSFIDLTNNDTTCFLKIDWCCFKG